MERFGDTITAMALCSQAHVFGGAAVLLALAVAVLLAVLRQRWKRRAVCWFCHEPQPGGAREASWTCVSCHQYNGFAEDGGYDRELAEQHAAEPPSRRYCTRGAGAPAPPPSVAAAPLCSQCEQNLQLKVAQLASFQPASEACFEEEATEYERSVEKLYPLCALCEQNVANEISLRNHMIRPLLLNTKHTTPPKRKASVGKQLCSRISSLLRWTSVAVSLWSLASVLLHCQEEPCFHRSVLLQRCCGLPRHMLGPATRLGSPLDTTPLPRGTAAGSTSPVTVEMSHDLSHDFLRHQRNGTCRARRKVDLLYECVIKPKEYCYMKTFCRSLHWLAGHVSSSFSQALSALTLLVFDTALVISRKLRNLHLCLLLLDAAVMCLLPHAHSQLPFRITVLKAVGSGSLGGVLVVASTALRIAAPLVEHRSSRRQRNKRALGARQERGEERARVELEKSSCAVENSLSSLSIGQVANGSRRRSWLQSLEEMNLLPPEPVAPGNPSGSGLSTSLTGLSTHEERPLDDSRKPLLRPARLRYRRFSINSATAALSLSGSSPGSGGMDQEPLLTLNGSGPRSGGMEREPLLTLNGSGLWSGGMEREQLLSRTESQPHESTPGVCSLSSGLSTAECPAPSVGGRQATVAAGAGARKPAGGTWRKAGQWCPWVVTVLLVASVTSNVVLLTCLLLHMYPTHTSPTLHRH